MNTTLNVSVRAFTTLPPEKDRWRMSGDIELCAGASVEVTGTTAGDETLCVLRDGREAWIATHLLH